MRIHQSGPALCELAERFRQIPFLNAFEDRHLKDILNASRMLVYDPDEIIIPEGAFGDHLYVLLGGKVRVVKSKSQIAVLYQVGEVFGELSALSNEIRTASVIAVETAWCLEVSPDSLKRLPAVERDACYALLYRFIAQVVAERLKKTTDELVLVTGELEVTRRKLAELRRKSNQETLDDELASAIEQLRRTKEKLSRLGRTDEASSPD